MADLYRKWQRRISDRTLHRVKDCDIIADNLSKAGLELELRLRD